MVTILGYITGSDWHNTWNLDWISLGTYGSIVLIYLDVSTEGIAEGKFMIFFLVIDLNPSMELSLVQMMVMKYDSDMGNRLAQLLELWIDPPLVNMTVHR